MNNQTQDLLRGRFRHYDAAAAAPLLHPDQSEDGLHAVRGQGKYPAVLMQNGVVWFPDRERRPKNQDGLPMKAKAPAGARPLLVDDPAAQRVIVCEGEGHAVALRSIGWEGVVVAGGVKALLANTPAAREQRRQRFSGRDVWVWFDFDAAGQEAAPGVAQQIMDAGATRVGIVDEPSGWPEGADVEDWLNRFETAGIARGALVQILGGTQWLTRNALAEKQEAEDDEPIIVSELLLPISGTEPALLTTVFDGKDIKLAVYGPAAAEQPAHRWSVQHDASAGPHAWQVVDEWRWAGVTYEPQRDEALRDLVGDKRFVLPAPPQPHGGHEALWMDVRAYVGRWLKLPTPEDYEALVAYVFLSYVIHSERSFEYCPYLRFYGPPGSGKGSALEVLRRLGYRAFSSKGTAGNLHRVVDFYASVTLFMDELHLDRGSKDRLQEFLDVLNNGSERSSGLLRCEGPQLQPKSFRIFGPKVSAGYGADEDEALARRTVAIDMGRVDKADVTVRVGIAPEMDAEAFALRGRLLDWRIVWQAPSMSGERAQRAIEVGGTEVAKYLWPLVAVAPTDEVIESLLVLAARRKTATKKARETSEDAVLLQALANAASHVVPDEAGVRHVPLEEVVRRLGYEPYMAAKVGRELRSRLKFEGKREWVSRLHEFPGGQHTTRSQVAVIFVQDQHAETFERHGVAWPPAAPESRAEAPL